VSFGFLKHQLREHFAWLAESACSTGLVIKRISDGPQVFRIGGHSCPFREGIRGSVRWCSRWCRSDGEWAPRLRPRSLRRSLGAVCWAWNRAQAGQPGRSQPPSGANGQRLAPVHARRKPGTNATGDQDTGRAARNRGAARQSLCGDKRNAQPGPPPLSPCECFTSLIVTKIISRTSLRPRAVGHRMPRIVSEILERPGVTSTPSPSSGARGDRRP
jgi:hypothetical protein